MSMTKTMLMTLTMVTVATDDQSFFMYTYMKLWSWILYFVMRNGYLLKAIFVCVFLHETHFISVMTVIKKELFHKSCCVVSRLIVQLYKLAFHFYSISDERTQHSHSQTPLSNQIYDSNEVLFIHHLTTINAYAANIRTENSFFFSGEL